MNSKLIKLLKIVSLVLVLCFVIFLIVDYKKAYPFGSAPFYVYILVRFIEFIIPASICFVASKLIGKRNNK